MQGNESIVSKQICYAPVTMGHGKTLSAKEMGRIEALRGENLSNRQIARKIERSSCVVNNYLRNTENYGKNRRGRTAMATTLRERRAIIREASNSSETARKIKERVGATASVRTVQRVIKKCPHLKRLKLRKKPQLSPQHREARLQFARDHENWVEEWKNIIFSDEKKFNLDGPDGYRYYYHDLRKEQRYLSRRHSGGGGVMVWAAISSRGPVDLVTIEGKQTAQKYLELISQQKANIDLLFGDDYWVYQHDNAPIHTAGIINNWFTENNIEVLQWPALSPDLNIIENLWGWLVKEVYAGGRQFETKEQLIGAIRETWNDIPRNLIVSLFNSIPRRVSAVIEQMGGHTRY